MTKTKTSSRTKWLTIGIFLLCGFLLGVCIYVGVAVYDNQKVTEELAEPQKELVAVWPSVTAGVRYTHGTDPVSEPVTEEPEDAPTGTPEPTAAVSESDSYPTSISANFTSLLQANPDTVGWLLIPDTKISFVVLHAEDTEEYLHKDFYGKASSVGSVFTLNTLSTDAPLPKAFLVYGHNMGVGRTAIFSTLVKYKDADYGKAHSELIFYSPYETITYRLYAVINIRVTDSWNYETTAFIGDADYESFLTEAAKRSLYDTGTALDASKRMITLSTCDRVYGGKNGRLVLFFLED